MSGTWARGQRNKGFEKEEMKKNWKKNAKDGVDIPQQAIDFQQNKINKIRKVKLWAPAI